MCSWYRQRENGRWPFVVVVASSTLGRVAKLGDCVDGMDACVVALGRGAPARLHTKPIADLHRLPKQRASFGARWSKPLDGGLH